MNRIRFEGTFSTASTRSTPNVAVNSDFSELFCESTSTIFQTCQLSALLPDQLRIRDGFEMTSDRHTSNVAVIPAVGFKRSRNGIRLIQDLVYEKCTWTVGSIKFSIPKSIIQHNYYYVELDFHKNRPNFFPWQSIFLFQDFGECNAYRSCCDGESPKFGAWPQKPSAIQGFSQ